MPTRCNRVFYCRSYCMFNMFRAPLCPSSEVQEYYTVVAACGISCCGFQQLENHSTKYHRQQPLYNTLELLMMGIVVPETCWASNKIRNKNLCCIELAFYFHILTTMQGQNHIKCVMFLNLSQHSGYCSEYTTFFNIHTLYVFLPILSGIHYVCRDCQKMLQLYP